MFPIRPFNFLFLSFFILSFFTFKIALGVTSLIGLTFAGRVWVWPYMLSLKHWWNRTQSPKVLDSIPKKSSSSRQPLDVLYSAPNDGPDKIEVDIIAVHGFGSNVDWSWTWKGSKPGTCVNWLKDLDMLPKIIPKSRIMVYNYDSKWHLHAPKTRLQLCGEHLVHSTHQFRNGIDRPIIFIGHSLGGNVIQNALLYSNCQDKYNYIPSITIGLIFLGTPFRGTKMQAFANIAAQFMTVAGSHKDIVNDLDYDSPTLTDKLHSFCELQKKELIPVSCFFELYETDYGRKVGVPGCITGKVVEEPSACIPGCGRFQLQTDHLAINKYSGPNDRSFLNVSDEIHRMFVKSADLLQQRKLASSQHHWMVPFGRNRDFTGRETIVGQLHRQTNPFSEEDNCQRTAVFGLGGVGKTQVALESAYRLREHCSVFWVPAVDAISFEKAYREIGQRLKVNGIDESKDVKLLVKNFLSQESSGSWLLVIDNADDPELLFGTAALSDYLPFSLKGSILFTTRNQVVTQKLCIPRNNTISLQKMSRDESRQLLEKLHNSSLGPDSPEKLLDFLDDLPLAIKQAAAYMTETGISAAKYLNYCRSSSKNLTRLISNDFEDQYRYREIENPVGTTWLISFQHIERDNKLAAVYLRFICLLAEKEIPLSLIPHEDNELDVAEAIGKLKSYALITERDETDFYDIHRLVRLAMRNWMVQEDSLQRYRKDLLQWVANVFPFPEHDNREEWMRLLPHVEGILAGFLDSKDVEVEPDLVLNVGEGYNKLGKYKEAEAMYRQALQVKEKVLGPEHPHTLNSINNLGSALDSQGKYEEAKAMYQQGLQVEEKVLGPEHPYTLNSINNLGNVLQHQGKYEEAEAMHQWALQEREKVLGPEHPDTLSSINNLGNALDSQGKYEEAEAMYLLRARPGDANG